MFGSCGSHSTFPNGRYAFVEGNFDQGARRRRFWLCVADSCLRTKLVLLLLGLLGLFGFLGCANSKAVTDEFAKALAATGR